MTLPASGNLKLSDIVAEFGGTAPHRLSEYYRGGAYVLDADIYSNVPTAGNIKLSQFYGLSNYFHLTISTNQINYDVNTNATALGWDTTKPLWITVNPGVVVYADDTTMHAMHMYGLRSAVILENNGKIIGMGGAGGAHDSVGADGGHALAASGVLHAPATLTIINNGIIAGGGGGGGAGKYFSWNGYDRSTPGSGGASGMVAAAGGALIAPGCAGQASQDTNSDGIYETPGASQNWGYGGKASSPGGKGGTWGVAGDAGGSPDGVYDYGGFAGGAAGACLSTYNVRTVTWQVAGTRYGSY